MKFSIRVLTENSHPGVPSGAKLHRTIIRACEQRGIVRLRIIHKRFINSQFTIEDIFTATYFPDEEIIKSRFIMTAAVSVKSLNLSPNSMIPNADFH